MRKLYHNILALVFFLWGVLIAFEVLNVPATQTIAVAALLALAVGMANTAENIKIQTIFRDALATIKTALSKTGL
jgi:hypothetical protein